MTDDIVARLRDGYHSLSGRPVVEEAADEIERLRAELQIMHDLIPLEPGHHHITVAPDGTWHAVAMRPAPVFWTGYDGETLALDPFYVSQQEGRAGEWAWVDVLAEPKDGARCPTPCDADCDAVCHEGHKVGARRLHDPDQCPYIRNTGDTPC